MNEKDQRNLNKVMNALNISSQKDFYLVIDYIISKMKPDSESTEKESLSYTEERKSPSERECHLYNINALTTHYDYIYDIWRNQMYPALRAIDSPLVGKLYDRFTDGRVFLMLVKKHAEKQLLPGEEARIN